MPRGYETFEHTADIGIRAWGNELPELFEEAAKALFSVIVDLKTVEPAQLIHIELSTEKKGTGNTSCLSPFFSGNAEELFLKWLKELLFIFETKHLLLSEFKVEFPPSSSPLPPVGGEDKGEGGELGALKLSAEVEGEVLNNQKHILGREVKAITRHQFKLTKDKSRYLAEVILDI
ncbi:MAG: archease [Candidatus Omnitrophica bacterium]|nr:archease [Candidatus Omnitrophota bacterium]